MKTNINKNKLLSSQQTQVQNTDYLHVGHVKEAHGLKGHLYLWIASGDCSWFEQLDTIKIGESFFSVIQAQPYKEGLKVSVDGIHDRTQAENLNKQKVFIAKSLLVSHSGESFYLLELLGFHVLDLNHNSVGTVIGFSSNGAQDLLQIEQSDRNQFETPFVKELVKDIDVSKRTLIMSIPEGLVELNKKKEKKLED